MKHIEKALKEIKDNEKQIDIYNGLQHAEELVVNSGSGSYAVLNDNERTQLKTLLQGFKSERRAAISKVKDYLLAVDGMMESVYHNTAPMPHNCMDGNKEVPERTPVSPQAAPCAPAVNYPYDQTR